MSPNQTHIEKIIALLESKAVTFIFAPLYPGYDGWYDTEKKISIIRWRMSPERTVQAVIHACLHALYPGAPHNWIWEKEKEVNEALTEKDRSVIKALLRRSK